MAKCRECGAEIPKGAEYCESCLSKLNTARGSEDYLDNLLKAMMSNEPESGEVAIQKRRAGSLDFVAPKEPEAEEKPVKKTTTRKATTKKETTPEGDSSKETPKKSTAKKETTKKDTTKKTASKKETSETDKDTADSVKKTPTKRTTKKKTEVEPIEEIKSYY